MNRQNVSPAFGYDIQKIDDNASQEENTADQEALAGVEPSEDVAAFRKSRTRHWPNRSTQYPRYASLSIFRQQALEVPIGAGMNAGRNLMAIFEDQGPTPRTRYKLKIERGRPSKQWPNAPSSDVVLPVGLSLAQICQHYSSHVWGTGLRLFMAEGWSGEEIWNVLPNDARNDKAAHRKWNYLQQAMGREADRMYEEDNNPKRIPLKRKLTDSKHDLDTDEENHSRARTFSWIEGTENLQNDVCSGFNQHEDVTSDMTTCDDLNNDSSSILNSLPAESKDAQRNASPVFQTIEATRSTLFDDKFWNEVEINNATEELGVLAHTTPSSNFPSLNDIRKFVPSLEDASFPNHYSLLMNSPQQTMFRLLELPKCSTSEVQPPLTSANTIERRPPDLPFTPAQAQVIQHTNPRTHTMDRNQPNSCAHPQLSLQTESKISDTSSSGQATMSEAELVGMSMHRLAELCKGYEEQHMRGIRLALRRKNSNFPSYPVQQQLLVVKQIRQSYHRQMIEKILASYKVQRIAINHGQPFTTLQLCRHLECLRVTRQGFNLNSFPADELNRRAWIAYAKLLQMLINSISKTLQSTHCYPLSPASISSIGDLEPTHENLAIQGILHGNSSIIVAQDLAGTGSLRSIEAHHPGPEHLPPYSSVAALKAPHHRSEHCPDADTPIQSIEVNVGDSPRFIGQDELNTNCTSHFHHCPPAEVLSLEEAKTISLIDILNYHPNALSRPSIAALFIDSTALRNGTVNALQASKLGMGAALQYLSRHENDFWSRGELEKLRIDHYAQEEISAADLHRVWDPQSLKIGLMYEPLTKFYENCLAAGIQYLKQGSKPKKGTHEQRNTNSMRSTTGSTAERLGSRAGKEIDRGMVDAPDAPQISEEQRKELKRREIEWNQFDQKTTEALRQDYSAAEVLYFRDQWSGIVEGLEYWTDDQVIELATGKKAVVENQLRPRKKRKSNA